MSEINGTISKSVGASNSETGSTSLNACKISFYLQICIFLVPEISAEQEFFLYELETTDSSSVGLILRFDFISFIIFGV